MRLALAAALAATSVAALPASAATEMFKADLSAQNEVPPHPDLKGAGHVEATVDTGSLKLTYHVTYEGLTGIASAAHFHGPAAKGTNAGVMVPVAGKVMDGMQGSATLTPAQLKAFEDGQVYFNIHTDANKAGEIRGQVEKAM